MPAVDLRPVALSAAVALCVGCSHEPRHQPRYDVTVSTGSDVTVLRAAFQSPDGAAWSDADCVGVRVREGREPPSLAAGRVDVWVPGGAIVGHVDLHPPRGYQAQVRGALSPGTRVAAGIAGSTSVAGHRFTATVPVPAPVRRTAPEAGFRLRPGAPLRVTWAGGDSSHVAVVVQVAHGAPEQSPEAWMLSCVVPRAPGGFTIPGAALAQAHLPPGSDAVSVAVTADGRAVDGEYALDVTPVGTEDDLVSGVVAP